VLATDPDRRGQGLATSVLGPVLTAAERTGSNVWLKTATAGELQMLAVGNAYVSLHCDSTPAPGKSAFPFAKRDPRRRGVSRAKPAGQPADARTDVL